MTNKHGNDILGMDIKLLKIKARVTPVYTNEGEINDEYNLRPISVISHIAKMIESFVSNQIMKYLEDHAFISIDQSAYFKRALIL